MPEFPGTLKPPRLASAPAGPVVGQMYYDTTLNQLRWWNGTTWTNTTGKANPTYADLKAGW